VRRLTAFVTIAVLAIGLSACGKHGAKNVYSCPNKGDGVGFTSVKKGKLTVQTALPAAQWWQGATVDKLTGGYEFELAKELCAQLGIGRVRIVDVDRNELVAGRTNSFDLGLAQIVPTTDAPKVDYSSGYYTTSAGESYAVLLPKGSANTKLVNTAIDKLKSSGALDALAKKWLTTN
jgi:polar amino acid transport system substrate-binding protein